ncbi:MAG: UDP-N-acetylglucosamine 2-epimerase (non-hydrolyzing) [Flavobacteriales bacterium]|nr:UDP-N-acetylglucosamine 2-epimerase (non-hydrolyzing) [Flavobacteriales bacterium]
MKILTVVGARPQFVKAATISRHVAFDPEVEEILVHTGQHFDQNMSEVFFEEMQIPKPKYNLNINALGHGAMTGRMLEEIEGVLAKEQPDILLVYGDTNSTIAGALAAKKLHIPVGHVEAGLRSFNMEMPEEVNRILTDRISDYLFCPTDTAINNLKKEGYDNIDCELVRTGDVMYDAALFYANYSEEKSTVLSEIGLENFALCTLHRAENTDNAKRLTAFVESLNEIHQELPVVCPLHPRTKKKLEENGLALNVHIIDPVGYFDMIELLKHCRLVFTDSGGLQKEAYFFNTPCITMRDQTEWVELVENGFNVLSEPNIESMREAFERMTSIKLNFQIDLYGDGLAAKSILAHLKSALNAG